MKKTSLTTHVVPAGIGTARPDPEEHLALVALARSHAFGCIEALADELVNGSGAARVFAAEALLERAYGKPEQAPGFSRQLYLEHHLPDEITDLLDGIYMNITKR